MIVYCIFNFIEAFIGETNIIKYYAFKSPILDLLHNKNGLLIIGKGTRQIAFLSVCSTKII